MGSRPLKIVIAGAGIAGLTAAIALARRGVATQVFERAPAFEEIGAGIQLSPNATRILRRLGILDRLTETAARPEAIELRRADSLRLLADVPLGDAAERRWGAPYLTVHRADLQAALLEAALGHPEIRLTSGATLRDAAFPDGRAVLSVEHGGTVEAIEADLTVGADGVWSTLRGLRGGGPSRFTGQLAWRAMVAANAEAVRNVVAPDRVTAFLHSGFHLVAYPVRDAGAINLVAIAPGMPVPKGWSERGDPQALRAAMEGASPGLRTLSEAVGPWSLWPIHDVSRREPWSRDKAMLLVGDAAHAMSPHAAQGAAMAIEDAETLATELTRAPNDIGAALAAYETVRRPRIERVARRGAFNRFAWHAGGPIAFVRDRVLSLRPSEKLAADLDWLYGREAPRGSCGGDEIV